MSEPALKRALRTRLPTALARPARRLAARPRWWGALARARAGHRRHGDRYPQPILYVAGLPKSGTSWLEGMLAAYPGYVPATPPSAVDHELARGGSHDFELPADLFDRLAGRLVVLKLHAHGSERNVGLLDERGLPYVVLHRDLRDVAVSHHFYVASTAWHPEHRAYRGRTVEEGIARFADTLLPAFVRWVEGWRARRDPERSLEITYGELRRRPAATFRRVARLFGLPDDDATVRRIVEAHRFERQSGGRPAGEEDPESFQRRGEPGGWREHFTPDLEERFREEAGGLLDEYGRRAEGGGDPGDEAGGGAGEAAADR